jgi:hypothetical protein
VQKVSECDGEEWDNNAARGRNSEATHHVMHNRPKNRKGERETVPRNWEGMTVFIAYNRRVKITTISNTSNLRSKDGKIVEG